MAERIAFPKFWTITGAIRELGKKFFFLFFFRFKLFGKPSIFCVSKGDHVEWSQLPTCQSKAILMVLRSTQGWSCCRVTVTELSYVFYIHLI